MDTETQAQAADASQDPGQALAIDTPATDVEKLRAELAEARKDAAKYRTSLRAEEQAKAERERAELEQQGEYKKLLEQERQARATLEQQVAAQARKQQQLDAALAAGLPANMAARLVGDDAEALLADAKALAEQLKPGAPATGATSPASQRGQQQAQQFDLKNPPKLSSYSWKK